MVASKVQSQLNVPFLHIADATGQAIGARKLQSVALMGTKMTMENEFFIGRLKSNFGIDVLLPGKEDRDAINANIFGDLSEMKITGQTKGLYKRVSDDLLSRNAQGIILACTELQFVLRPEDVSVPLFDTVELHAKGAADWMLSDS